MTQNSNAERQAIIDRMDVKKLRETIYQERRFYSMIVHEIRTQVGIVGNLSEMLLDEKLHSSHKFYKQSLQQTAARITRLSQNFLEIDQFRDNKIKLNVEAVELSSFMEIFVMPYVHMAANKGLLLKLMVEEKCPKYINIDVTRLGQILSNLIENAIKYTEKGQVQIHVHYDGNQKIPLMFDVIDTGIGIDFNNHAARRKIFAEYSRLDNALDQKGVGLGLWIIKNLAQIMDGEIEVITDHVLNEKGGSCFRFLVPINVTKQPIIRHGVNPNMATIAENTKLEVEIQNHYGRVLLVEDNKLNQHIIGTMLEGANLEFDVASSLQEALQLVNLRDYALILLDLNLPDGRGEELVENFEHLNVVALTADIEEGLEARLKALGFIALIQKPIVIKDFFNRIYAILPKKI